MTPVGAGNEGVLSKFSSGDAAFDSERAWCAFVEDPLALQQACASIDIDPDIGWLRSLPTLESLAAVRA